MRAVTATRPSNAPAPASCGSLLRERGKICMGRGGLAVRLQALASLRRAHGGGCLTKWRGSREPPQGRVRQPSPNARASTPPGRVVTYAPYPTDFVTIG